MTETPNNLISYGVSTALLLAGWARSQVWCRTLRYPWTLLAFLGRSVLGFLTLLAGAGLAQHALVFSTNWPLWSILLPGAVLIETVIALARLERNIIPHRAGKTLTILRVTTFLTVILTLCQPVVVLNVVHQLHRRIVILLDISASMQVADNNLTLDETVRLAETLRIPAAHRASPTNNEAFLLSLSDSDRQAVNRVASLTRVETALRLLTTRPDPAGTDKSSSSRSRLERLHHDYGVQFYTFAALPTEINTETLISSTSTVAALPTSTLPLQKTDIAGALANIAISLRPEETAGVLLISDGRHNSGGPIDTVARRFQTQQVPVFPLVLGGNTRPPTDAAIVSVNAPESACTKERVSFSVKLKIDGLASSNVTVILFDGIRPVASNTVTPPDGASFRTQVLLSDAPATNGMHAYRVQVQHLQSDVDTNNNVVAVPVRVGGDPINVLLIENYPRWEFRYLKNLFTQRDKNVRLQYLLLNPDRIARAHAPPPRPASVTAKPSEAEATRLPSTEADWMKFDVIILGDVPPAALGQANMEILRTYVRTRGGSLIIIAGSRHMPQSYDHTPLADILPVTFKPAIRPLLNSPDPEFRLALTPAGRNALFMKLDDNPAENLNAWSRIPALHWRNSSLTAKHGATVLAHAVAPDRKPEGMPAHIPDADSLLHQQQRERENALIVTHQDGFGSVLMFAFDQTWRLRYRYGDCYHHKLWGQILSWATTDGITTGSGTVRICTDRARYPSDAPVRILARLATPAFSPITNATPHATLWMDGRKLSRHRLTYREGSQGIYVAEIATPPAGQYRVELDASGISGLATTPPGATIAAEFAVAAGNDTETIDLTADRGELTRLAEQTGGSVLEPTDLDSIEKRLGPARITTTERRQLDLWNSWPWFLLIVTLMSAEWLLRKKVRLP